MPINVTKPVAKPVYRKPRATHVGAVDKLTAGPSIHRAEENAYKGK